MDKLPVDTQLTNNIITTELTKKSRMEFTKKNSNTSLFFRRWQMRNEIFRQIHEIFQIHS